MKPTKIQAEEAVRTLLRFIGEDLARDGLQSTPTRVVNSYLELFQGYQMEAADLFAGEMQKVSGYNDVITLSNIEFVSYCEHHMSPIIGQVTISYVPGDKIIGIGRLARLVDIFAKRLQLQERITLQIATAIEQFLQPKGVSVEVTAAHHCLDAGGVKRTVTNLITIHKTGCFLSKATQI